MIILKHMKMKYIGVILLAFVALYGCDDNTGSLGMGMLPSSDIITSQTTSFDVSTRSFLADKVYAKTSTGYVGRFTDPTPAPNGFGDYEASFLTELNCTDNFTLPKQYDDETHTGHMAGDTVVSAQLVVYYSSWFGDSLNACRMSVYELKNKLDKDRYTNIHPEQYYDKSDPSLFALHKAFTAYDTAVPDSVRNATDSYGYSTFYPNVTFPLPKAYGNKILHLCWEHPEYFKNSETFIDNVLKGVYIKNDYGDGTILYVDRVDLQMQFRFHYVDSISGAKLLKEDGTDSLYYSIATVFASTKEVIQANQFKNSDLLAQRAAEQEHTYLKSPAGIFTEATLPYDEIYERLANDTLNAVKLTFSNYNQSANKYKFSMNAPTTVLLVRKSEMESFFENNELIDNITSFIATHNNVATNQYVFKNIARLVATCINEKQTAKQAAREQAGSGWNEAAWEAQWKAEKPDWDKVLIVPVTVTYDTSGTSQTMTGISHDLTPSYARLAGGDPVKGGTTLKMDVTYTTFNK